MAQQQWEIEPTARRCSATDRELQEGEVFYSVLFEDGDSFRRQDFAEQGWQGPPEGSFCYFKTKVPVREKRKKLLVDNEMLVSFFLRLTDDTEPVRIQFRFVLALLLMRKRCLRYEGSSVEHGNEVWNMTLVIDQSSHDVINPRLTDDQIEGVSEQLTAILHGDTAELIERHQQRSEDAPASDGEPGDEES